MADAESPAAVGLENGRGASTPPGDDLERVRAILFGQKEGEIEARLRLLEESIAVSVAELKQTLHAESERLVELVAARASEVHGRVDVEEARRRQAHEESAEALRSQLADVIARLDENATVAGQSIAALRDSLEKNQESVRSELVRQLGELKEVHEETQERLSATKTDRRELAAMFDGIARSLRGE
jgi:hypothetical protein